MAAQTIPTLLLFYFSLGKVPGFFTQRFWSNISFSALVFNGFHQIY